MSYPRKIFWGTVLILNLEIQDKQCRKMAGNFERESILGILFEIFSMEPCGKLKWNPD